MTKLCLSYQHYPTGAPIHINVKAKLWTRVATFIDKLKLKLVAGCPLRSFERLYYSSASSDASTFVEITDTVAQKSLSKIGVSNGAIIHIEGPLLSDVQVTADLSLDRLQQSTFSPNDELLANIWTQLKDPATNVEAILAAITDPRCGIERREVLRLSGKSPAKGLLIPWTHADISSLGLATLAGREDVIVELRKAGALVDAGHMAPLFVASYIGNVSAIELLIAHGAKVNAIANISETRLLHFIESTDSKPYKTYMKYLGGNNHERLKQLDVHGGTALHFAACAGNASAVRALIENGADTALQNSLGCTALHIAARYGHVEVMRLLIEHKSSLIVSNIQRHTPMHFAAAQGQVNALKQLASAASDNFETQKFKVACQGALTLAARFRRPMIARYIQASNIDEGSSVEAFQEAIHVGDAQQIAILLNNGGSVNNLPLHKIISSCQRWQYKLPLLELLSSQGADVGETCPRGLTILHVVGETQVDPASNLGTAIEGIIDFALANGVDRKALDNNGRTAVRASIIHNAFSLQHLIQRHRCNIDDINDAGSTPLHIAVSNYNLIDSVSILLKCGARVDLVDKLGNTALHSAALTGTYLASWQVIKLLVEYGASRTARNSLGETPLDVFKINQKHSFAWSQIIDVLGA